MLNHVCMADISDNKTQTVNTRAIRADQQGSQIFVWNRRMYKKWHLRLFCYVRCSTSLDRNDT